MRLDLRSSTHMITSTRRRRTSCKCYSWDMSRIVRLVHLGWGLKKVGSFPSFSLCFGYANWKNQMEKGLDLPHCAKRNLYGNSLTTNPNREVPPNIRKNNRYVSDLNPRGDPKQQRTFAKSAAQSNTVTHDHTTDRSVF